MPRYRSGSPHHEGVKLRTIAETEAFFAGLELLPPGVVMIDHWHPDKAAAEIAEQEVWVCGDLGRKP